MVKKDEYEGGKRIGTTISLFPKDREMLEWVAEYLGCSRSEAVRTAIRFYTKDLVEIDKRTAQK